jgi:hypothetical protein
VGVVADVLFERYADRGGQARAVPQGPSEAGADAGKRLLFIGRRAGNSPGVDKGKKRRFRSQKRPVELRIDVSALFGRQHVVFITSHAACVTEIEVLGRGEIVAAHHALPGSRQGKCDAVSQAIAPEGVAGENVLLPLLAERFFYGLFV